MRKLALTLMGLFALSAFVFAGTEYSGKEMKQVAPPPCPEWYGDTEWNVAVWGAYAFGGSNDVDVHFLNNNPNNVILSAERSDFLGEDGGWGGGIDIKYFFHRYFGIGLEGYGLFTDHDRITSGRLAGEFGG